MGQFLPLTTWPVLWSAGVLVALITIFYHLRRLPRMRRLGPLFFVGTLLLALVLLLDGEGVIEAAWLHNLLLGTLLVCWGYILFDLSEFALIDGLLHQRSVLVPRLARDIVRGVVIVALALLAASWIFGVSLNSLVISSTVISAVIGLALQDLLKNVVAGVALQAEQPFDSGDWVLFNNQPARIIEMSWRATRMVTVDNTHLIVPNATLAQANIENYTVVSPIQALHVQIALNYQHPPGDVKRALRAAALAAEGVLSDPPPGIRLIAYGDYSVTYDIKFWMRGFDRYVETRDAVMTNAWYFLRRAGIRMPLPVREVYQHNADPVSVADERQRQVEDAMGLLAEQEIFGMLEPGDLATLAAHSERLTYGAGELLVRQGDSDDALFIIVQGAVRVDAAGADGVAVTVGRLGPGDVFGELALLTGAPRSATVVATAETEALAVRRPAVAPLLERNPALPERLGEVLERRSAQTRAALAGNRSAAPAPGEENAERSLGRRIRDLFGLGA